MKRILIITALVLATVAAQAQTVEVTVGPKEQLGSIAQRYLVEPATAHWQELAKLNKLSAPYTLYPGSTLLLPTRLLASQSTAAKWLAVSGSVTLYRKGQSAIPVTAGGTFLELDRVVVAKDASAVLELSDGSRVKVLSNTELVLDEHRYFRGRANAHSVQPPPSGTKSFAGLLRLIQGSVEATATPATDRAKPLRIQTPTSVVGVRGTDFRVSHEAETLGSSPVTIAAPAPILPPEPSKPVSTSGTTTRAEVTEGRVLAQLDEARKVDVDAGYGVRLDEQSKGAPVAVLLLDAPDLTTWKNLQDRPVMEFAGLPAIMKDKKVTGYRVQIAPARPRDPAVSASNDPFAQIVFDRRFLPNEILRVPNLEDGVWRMRVRALDESGIEGKNVTLVVTLKARPEPPIIQKPGNETKFVQTDDIDLQWAGYSGASGYLLELKDQAGQRIESKATQARATLKRLAPGRYTWRLATQIIDIRGNTDTGPWGDAQSFTVIALPDSAQGKLDTQGKTLALRWADQKASEYEVHIGRDPNFTNTSGQLMQLKTLRPNLLLSNPESGKYFIRYRAIEKDGFVGGWSGVMQVEVPADWMHLLLYLGGGTTKWP